jgi:hypothetical protein
MLVGIIVRSLKINQHTNSPFGDIIFVSVAKAKDSPDKKRDLVDRIKISLVIVFGVSLLMTLTGCIGWVGGGDGYYGEGYYGDGGWWGGWWGGGGHGYDRGHDVHVYSARGAGSRGTAHGGGGGHASGGGGHGGGKR